MAFPAAVKSVPHVRNVQNDNESENLYKRGNFLFPGAQLIRCLAIHIDQGKQPLSKDNVWTFLKSNRALRYQSVICMEISSKVSEVGSRILPGLARWNKGFQAAAIHVSNTDTCGIWLPVWSSKEFNNDAAA